MAHFLRGMLAAALTCALNALHFPMTPRQRISLMAELWPNACQSQGWNEADRALRLFVCSIAVQCQIKSLADFQTVFRASFELPLLKSTNEIDSDKQFTRVKSLLLMLADDLQGAGEVDNPHANKARQMLHLIKGLTAQIALYHPNAPGYVLQICRDKFNVATLAELTAAPIELRNGRRSPSQLQQMLLTLNARLKQLKKAAAKSEEGQPF